MWCPYRRHLLREVSEPKPSRRLHRESITSAAKYELRATNLISCPVRARSNGHKGSPTVNGGHRPRGKVGRLEARLVRGLLRAPRLKCVR
jgi:hypothetical protein